MACPKCGYERKPSDSAPDWQCPACGIAIEKYRAIAVAGLGLVASPKRDLSHLRLSFPARLVSAAPDLALSGLFLWCWYSPVALRRTLASELGLLMAMEFFVIHAGIFFYAFSGSIVALLVLLVLYLAAGGAFAFFHGGWAPTVALGWLLASQAISAFVGRGPLDFAKKRQFFYWSQGAACYVVFGVLAVFLHMPKLGFGSARGRGYFWDSWWSVPPNEVMAWGFLTFGVLGLLKLLEQPEWIEDQPAMQSSAEG